MTETSESTSTAAAKAEPRKFKVKNFIDAEKFKTDVTYSTVDLSNAMVEQASLFAHYGTLAAKATFQVDTLKLLLETTEGKVYRTIRDRMVTAGTKTTEAQLEKEVVGNGQVIAIKSALNEAKQIEGIAKSAAEAFRHRRDMLVQQGLITREEMKGEVSISAKKVIEESDAALRERVLARLDREAA